MAFLHLRQRLVQQGRPFLQGQGKPEGGAAADVRAFWEALVGVLAAPAATGPTRETETSGAPALGTPTPGAPASADQASDDSTAEGSTRR